MTEPPPPPPGASWNPFARASPPPAAPPAPAPPPAAAPDPKHPELTIESFLAEGGGVAIVDGVEPVAQNLFRDRRSSLVPTQMNFFDNPTDYVRLDAVERQQHMQLWARRKATDQAKHPSQFSARQHGGQRSNRGSGDMAKINPGLARAQDGNNANISYDHELKADRKGVGFAYGGVSPGTLHARGQLVRVHTVHYSIGLAGKYRLHIGLRQQSIALPGSPFDLEVVPGHAYAPSTKLPKESLPLRGVVGEEWRGMVIFAADKIGNQCITGGAKVQIHVDHDDVQATCTDNGDGSYGFKWRSQRSGTYQVGVTIDDVPVVGSPTTLTMLAANLAVGNCEATGVGLTDAVAGKPAVMRIKCKDRYSNMATPATTLKFGISLAAVESAHEAKEKRKKGQEQEETKRGRSKNEEKDDEARERKKRTAMDALTAQSFEGFWVDGEYEIRYIAQKAGDHQLHLWADPDGSGERTSMPGSPFLLRVVENVPAPASSNIGYPQEEKKNIYAGEKLVLRPQLRDQFGNPSAAPPEEVVCLLEGPDGQSTLPVKPSNKGLGAYEISCESVLKGEYTLHVELNGQPIGASPGLFFVLPAVPTAVRSKLLPPDGACITHHEIQLVLIAVDKLGNTLDRGGARVDARALGPNASQCTVEDRKDGTYTIAFTGGAVGEYRVIARLDNIEMTPLVVQVNEAPQRSPKDAPMALAAKGDGKAGKGKDKRRNSVFPVGGESAESSSAEPGEVLDGAEANHTTPTEYGKDEGSGDSSAVRAAAEVTVQAAGDGEQSSQGAARKGSPRGTPLGTPRGRKASAGKVPPMKSPGAKTVPSPKPSARPSKESTGSSAKPKPKAKPSPAKK